MLVLTGLTLSDKIQQKPSVEEMDKIAQEAAKYINEWQLDLAQQKLNEMTKNFDDKTKEDIWSIVKTKLTPETLEKLARMDQKTKLEGVAEDLWGNKIDLSKYNKGLVLMHPFSPSNCGYCLVDGEFVKVNYYENTKKEGGQFFGTCLFNPQLDVYSFMKHYREDFPVLAGPVSLHKYHRDGFPYMIAFNDGELIYSNPILPYEDKFHELREKFWKGKDIPLRPTSPLKLAEGFIWENESQAGVIVCADGDEVRFNAYQKRYKELQERSQGKFSAFTAKYESQLTDEDYRKNLCYDGFTEGFKFKPLEGEEAPITMASDMIKFGNYTFPKAGTGINACFPNPLNKEKYIILSIRGSNVKTNVYERWLDYTIYGNTIAGFDNKANILVHGLFEKNGGDWNFSESLAYDSEDEIPESIIIHKEHKPFQSKYEATGNGELWTLGNSECRFPSTIVDHNGICWTAWEEQGDIMLASVAKGNEQKVIYVEDDQSDSFNPLLAVDNENVWIFYLNNHDGFYRLYAKYLDGHNLSDEICISGKEPMDVVTPAATFDDNGRIIVTWSEWQANGRILKYLTIIGKALGQTQMVKVAGDSGFAWCPSLAMDSNGKVWGTWNQHYPSILCVCVGDLTNEAKVVNDTGGYPSIVFDKNSTPWVFWESSAWDVFSQQKTQTILASYYDSENQQWSPSDALSMDQTLMNQTPKAVVDKEGMIWVVWSGRKDENSPWNIYVSYFDGNSWSDPKIVSSEGENARAPVIFIDENNMVWITWHSGTGSDMKIKVLKMGHLLQR